MNQQLPPVIRKPWHEAVIDMMIADPTLTQKDIAARLNKTEGWLSIVRNSDGFKKLYAERKAEIVDPLLIASTEDRLTAVVDRASEEFLRRVDLGQVANKDLVAAMRAGTAALGMGGSSSPTMQQNLYVIPAPSHPHTIDAWKAKVAEVIDVPVR